MSRKPDFEVFVSEKNGENTFYTKVGAAWKVGADGVSIKLRPNLAITNECVLFPPKEDDQ